ncbi:cytochrome-c peroxidase [Bergeriella denitrificans]|nr:cytochrome c peroxidase [Bergeriella denitrificans]
MFKLLTRSASVAALLLMGGCALLSSRCPLEETECLRRTYSRAPQYWPRPVIDEGVRWRELAPISTPQAADSPKVRLGKMLFHETRLSADNSIACRHCHLPAYGFAEPKKVSSGVGGRLGRRNSISLLHLSEPQHFFFWDGRARTLEQQVLMPISDPVEMDLSLSKVVPRLAESGYAPYFQTAFGRDIDLQGVADALAAYLRTLRPQPTRFDRFLLGEADALNDSELRGLHLFRTKARCLNCHSGPMMTDGLMHNLNQALPGRPAQDLGQYAHSGRLEDWGKFKTPSLRNLSRSKPWFHHGLFVNLRGIVAIYNNGMQFGIPANAPPEAYENRLDPLIKPLGLSPSERQDLTAFLEVL